MVYNSHWPTLAEHRRDGCEFAMALNNNEYVNYAYTRLYILSCCGHYLST